jgi:hypothetical protein
MSAKYLYEIKMQILILHVIEILFIIQKMVQFKTISN